jgi:hypothetical protein
MPTVLPSASFGSGSSYQQAPPGRYQTPAYTQQPVQNQLPVSSQYYPPVRPVSQTPSSTQKQVRALFDFDAENANELSSNDFYNIKLGLEISL